MLRPALEGSRQVLGQQVRPGDGVHSRELHHFLGVLSREHLPLAALPPVVSVGQVEGRLARGAVQQEVGVGDLDAGEVVEVVRLPEPGVPGRRRRPLENRDGALPDGVVHARAARGELLRGKVRREERETFLGGGHPGQRQTEC